MILVPTPRPPLAVDPLLLPFLRAADVESDDALAQLLSAHAEPVIKNVISTKMQLWHGESPNPDAEDLQHEALLQVIAALREFKANSNRTIADFRSYVAVVAYHVCYSYFRKKRPYRWRLKNNLRYLLTKRAEFALWTNNEGESLCGLAPWQASKRHRASAGLLRQLREDPSVLEHGDLAALVRRILLAVDGPIELDDLMNTVAGLQGIQEPVFTKDDDRDSRQPLPSPRGDVADEVEQRSYLQRLWAEIGQLPLRQRIALLLNLRDPRGSSSIELFLLLGITDFPAMAAALGMQAEELADLWNELPLDDSRIAGRLRLTRQQVINLRKAARDRLQRRMRDF